MLRPPALLAPEVQSAEKIPAFKVIKSILDKRNLNSLNLPVNIFEKAPKSEKTPEPEETLKLV